MRDSFVFYRSYKNALDYLDAETKMRLMEAIFNYALDDKEPTLDGLERSFFELVRPQIDINTQRYENGKKGAEYGKKGGAPKGNQNARKKPNNPYSTPIQPQTTPNVNDNDTVNDNVTDTVTVNKSNGGQAAFVSESRQKKFIKPTVKEIADYCRERNNNVDAQTFFDFYESKGWLIGKTPMRDWKASVRTWEQKEDRKPTTQNGSGLPIGSNPIPNEIKL